MIVLDTHAWVWWLTGSKPLSGEARRAIDEADFIGIPTIACWELALLVRRGNIAFDRDVLLWMREALLIRRVALLDITPEIAVEAVQLDWHHRDPADRLIVATTIVHAASLVTKDDTIHAFAPVRAIW